MDGYIDLEDKVFVVLMYKKRIFYIVIGTYLLKYFFVIYLITDLCAIILILYICKCTGCIIKQNLFRYLFIECK